MLRHHARQAENLQAGHKYSSLQVQSLTADCSSQGVESPDIAPIRPLIHTLIRPEPLKHRALSLVREITAA